MKDSLPTKELPIAKRLALFFCVIGAVFLAVLAGCGYTGSTAAPAIALGGSVQGGHQPVSGASVQIYSVGTNGKASTAQPLLSDPVKSDSNGNFSIPAAYTCPSASSQIYIVASGGITGGSSSNNPNLVLSAMLGSCSNLSGSPVSINEVTTVGSVWPLAAYMTDATHLGSTSSDPAFVAAAASVPEFVNNTQGSSPGTPTATSYFAENAKLYSLADALANCVNSSGGSAGDGSPCGLLFSTATPAGASAPTDTLTAALHIAQSPKSNVGGIYSLAAAETPFQPALTTAPTDWALNLSFMVATPAISLPTGRYAGTQEVTLSDSTPGSAIYYTTDGTVPTSSSLAYSGPIAIAITTTVQAIAVLQGSQSGVASSTLTLTPASLPAKLVFLQQPSNSLAQATISPAVTVAVEDINGNLIPIADDPVQLSIADGTSLSGTPIVTPQNGVATFTNLIINTPGTYTLVATGPNLPPAISASFTISAPSAPASPAKLGFLQQPSNASTGATLSPAVTVLVEDNNGNPVPTAANPVTVALTSGTGLAGTLTVTPQNGIATFSTLSEGTAGTYTLSATSPSLNSATSTSFTISAPGGGTAPPPAKLAFSQQPSNALTGAALLPAVTVVVEDGNGNPVTAATNPVTLALSTGKGLAGTLTVTPQNGIATFSTLSVSAAGTYTLSATSPDLVAATSTSFTITASGGGTPVPAKLAFSQQPSNALTGATLSPAVTVIVEDSNGNPVTAATNPVTVALTAGSGLGGTLTVTPQNGIATFSTLSLSTAGSYSLSATSPSLASATSVSFTITASGGGTPVPAKLAFSQQPSAALTGASITPAVTVVVEDSSGNPVTSATNPVTVALTSGTGLTGTLTITPQNGIATFSNLSESTAGSYTLSATSTGLTSATSNAFSITSSSGGANYWTNPGSANSPFNTALTSSEQLSAVPAGFSALNIGLSSWFTPAEASSPGLWQASTTDPKVTVLFNEASYDNVNSGAWQRENNSAAVEAQILASSSIQWALPQQGFGLSAKYYYMTTTAAGSGWIPPLPPALNTLTAPPATGLTVYAPKNATPAADSDGYFAIFQPDGSVLECYSGIVLSSGTIVCGTFNVTYSNSPLTGAQGGVMASTVPVYAGLIRQADMDAGVIAHALNVCISPTQLANAFVSPAITFDRTSKYSGTLPMGTHLAIPLSVDLSAHTFQSQIGAIVAKAMQNYGAFLLDRGGPNGFTIRTEKNVTSTMLTNGSDIGADLDMNWILSQLEVVQ